MQFVQKLLGAEQIRGFILTPKKTYDWNTDKLVDPLEQADIDEAETVTKLQREFIERELETKKEEERIQELAEKTTSIKEKAELEKKAEEIKKLYALDYWMRCFNRVSYVNSVAGQALFHVCLGQALCNHKISLEDDSEIDLRMHFLWLQDSGCLSGNTKIVTKNGASKINALPEIFMVRSYNFATQREEYKLAKKINTGIKKLYKITLENGASVFATSEHKFYVNNKEIEVKDLAPGLSITVK
jgi:hypothetical protein